MLILNKKILAVLILLSIFFSWGQLALAAADVGDVIDDLNYVAGQAKVIDATNPSGEPTIYDFIGKFINLFLAFIGVIFLVLIIFAGYTWMMARGNEQEIEKAVKLMENGAVGLVYIIMAYLIMNFVIFKLMDITITTAI